MSRLCHRARQRGFAVLILLAVASGAYAEPQPRPRILLGPMLGAGVVRAVEGARRRLAEPGCAQIFAEFHDAAGRSLQDALDARGLSAAEYLDLIVYADGWVEPRCRLGHVLALTAPGARVVFVCGPAFLLTQAQDPGRAENTIIHEALHTLGLGENPPTSQQITTRVQAVCLVGR